MLEEERGGVAAAVIVQHPVSIALVFQTCWIQLLFLIAMAMAQNKELLLLVFASSSDGMSCPLI